MVLLTPKVLQFPQEKLVGLKNKRAAVFIIMLRIGSCFLFVFK